MWLILLFLLAGSTVGFLLRRFKKFNKTADTIAMYIIYLLLFVMGLRIGSNPEIMDHFDTIGIQAVVIALFAVAGSILLSRITYHYFFRDEK